jgi:hypothetical protein
MDHNNTLILDADDTDTTFINNEVVCDALLLMGGNVLCYYAFRTGGCAFYIDPVPAIGSSYWQYTDKPGSYPTWGCGWELSSQENEKRCM